MPMSLHSPSYHPLPQQTKLTPARSNTHWILGFNIAIFMVAGVVATKTGFISGYFRKSEYESLDV